MAVTVDYQAWDSVSYNWLDKTTSSAAPQQINDKLSTWITSVNANASNSTKQITIEKGPSDSTSANYIGWIIKLNSSSTDSLFYFAFFSNTTTNIQITSNKTWTAGTANGGYGTLSGAQSGQTNASFKVSGEAAEFTIATETANGQEFFALGYKTGASTGNQGAFVLFKDTNGEWASYSGGGFSYGSYYMPVYPAPQRCFGVGLLDPTAGSASILSPLMLRFGGTLPSSGERFTLITQPASPSLLANFSTSSAFSFNRYATLADGSTCIALGYSPVFVAY